MAFYPGICGARWNRTTDFSIISAVGATFGVPGGTFPQVRIGLCPSAAISDRRRPRDKRGMNAAHELRRERALSAPD